MKIFGIIFLKLIVFIVLILVCNNCAKWHKNAIKIERFQYLDESPYLEAYLIRGYDEKYDQTIQEMADRYMCDSIVPNNKTYYTKYFAFFKETQNTNRENFKTRPKHKIIYAQSRDKLFSYSFTVKDSVIVIITKTYEVYDTEISFQDFYCD